MTNQASEDELGEILKQSYKHIAYSFIATLPPELKYYYSKTAQTLDYEKEFNYTKAAIQSHIRTEKLKLLDEVIHQSTVNLKSAKAVAGWAELRKKQLEAELSQTQTESS